jgi:hypothetical protein
VASAGIGSKGEIRAEPAPNAYSDSEGSLFGGRGKNYWTGGQSWDRRKSGKVFTTIFEAKKSAKRLTCLVRGRRRVGRIIDVKMQVEVK